MRWKSSAILVKLRQLKSVNFHVEKCLLVGTHALANVESVAKVVFTYRVRNRVPKSYSVGICVQQGVQIYVHHAKRSVHTRVSMGGVVITARITANLAPIAVNGNVGTINVPGPVASIATERSAIIHV